MNRTHLPLFGFMGAFIVFCALPNSSGSRNSWDSPFSVTFPGKRSEVPSPNRLFKIRDIPPEGERGHSLFLLNQHNRKIWIENPVDGKIFYRSMDILWCPDNSCFILNYWRGSNLTISYLYKLVDLKHPIDINKRIQPELEKRVGRETFHSLHFLYVYADRWLDAKTVKIKVQCNYAVQPSSPEKNRNWTAKEISSSYKWNLLKDSAFQLLTDE